MISKTSLLAALAALPFAAGVAHAGSPLLPLNNDGSTAIFFVADASTAYNDNLFYQPNKTDDVIFTVAPGFQLVAGGDGNSKFDLVFKESLSAYVDHSSLNTQLANVDAKYTYDAQQAFKGSITAGFHQTQQPTNQTNIAGDIVKTNTFNGGANGEYKATEKSTVTLGVNYNGSRYTSFQNLFNDQDSIAVPANWYYAVTDKFDAGFAYSYTTTNISRNDTQSGPDAISPLGYRTGKQEVHFAGLTARGSATEKLKLEANAGVGFSSLKSVAISDASGTPISDSDSTTFNFTLKSTYVVTEKLTASLSGGRNFAVSAIGGQTTTTNGNLGVSYAISEDWSANANLGYMVQEFDGTGRKDNIITAGFGASYQLNKFVSFSANYAHFNDDMNVAGGDFDTNVVTLSASVKY